MKNPKKLAELLTKNIMVYHDNANYKNLEKNSEKLVKEMGYAQNIASKIASKIKNIYIFYDKAQIKYEKNAIASEKRYYEKSKNLAQEINQILNNGNDCTVLVDIVIEWRHKNKIGALFQIFKYWKQNLSIIDAIKSTILQIKAAKSHDSRDKKRFEQHFLEIYEILLKNNVLPLLF